MAVARNRYSVPCELRGASKLGDPFPQRGLDVALLGGFSYVALRIRRHSADGLTKSTLKAMKNHCHTFTDGVTLIQELQRESFDRVVLDWNFPDISGLDIVRWVRSNVREHVPIPFVATDTRNVTSWQDWESARTTS